MSLYKPKKGYVTSGDGQAPNFAQSDLSRSLPRQMSTGYTRGTQSVGQGNMKLDGANNRILIGNPTSGSVGMGIIPNTDNEFGFFALDIANRLIFKIVDGTLYMYDAETGDNTLQMGIMPDGTTALAIAKEGYSVDEAF